MTPMSRRRVLAGLSFAPLAFAALLAGAPLSPLAAADVAVNADASGLALQGHDPVAYFTEGRPVAGREDLTASHEGATYRFSSAANRARFLADPAAHVPAYGGYCAFGTAMGYKVKIDPAAFSIVDDRLYLNYSKGVQSRWQEDPAGYIAKADENWTTIRDKSPEELRP